MNYAALAFNSANLFVIALVKFPYTFPHSANDDLERNLEYFLARSCFVARVVITLNNYAFADKIKGTFDPHVFAQMGQVTFDIFQVIHVHPSVIAQLIQYFKRKQITKRIESYERSYTGMSEAR
ncbi:MAG: hypothetical protein K0S00_250 [Xanthobacteraceae bacterium]|nr:hypothetical protein [Xanthobacteraceae bacterium]